MDAALAAWIRQQREARGWPKAEMARQLVKVARDADDKSVPGPAGMLDNIYRWERKGGVSERHKHHLCRLFGIKPHEFGPSRAAERPRAVPQGGPLSEAAPSDRLIHAKAAVPVLGPADPGMPAPAAIPYRGRQESGPGCLKVEQEVLMAAHEGSDRAAEHEQGGVGEATLEQLRADLVRLSRLTDSDSPLTAFLEARRVRDRIYRLLDRRRLPREQGDLYLLVGCVNGLMGINANRLGYPDAAEELIRSGWAYANATDHAPLRGLLRAKLSTVMYWRGRFRESHELAVDGLRYLSQGPVCANLHLNRACAAARLGDPDIARQAVELAHAAREASYQDELVEIGGEEFALSRATTSAKAGRAFADTGTDGRRAEAELEHAISLYVQGGTPGEQHWFGGKPLADTDLGVVRLRSGALDAAAAALEPVLVLPPAQRVSTLTTRLAGVRDELAAPIFRDSAQARDLGDRIEVFGREAVTAGLHSLSG
jgi:hypothetical protein